MGGWESGRGIRCSVTLPFCQMTQLALCNTHGSRLPTACCAWPCKARHQEPSQLSRQSHTEAALSQTLSPFECVYELAYVAACSTLPAARVLQLAG